MGIVLELKWENDQGIGNPKRRLEVCDTWGNILDTCCGIRNRMIFIILLSFPRVERSATWSHTTTIDPAEPTAA
jgi:hypothetical protein